jgi:hypothetical protein
MEESKCKKQYPRKFQSETVMDVNGYLIYQRRGAHFWFMELNWTIIGWYRTMFTKYDAHINVKVCNNICAVKYLFKYIYKGHDHAIVEISCQSNNGTEGNVVEADDIKKYLDYRYVSTSEAVWRIFKFDMHERFLVVEHLQYHLPNQQMVLFNEDDDVQKMAAVTTLAFGLRPRQGGCKVTGLEVDPGVTSHAPGSAKSPESVRE